MENEASDDVIENLEKGSVVDNVDSSGKRRVQSPSPLEPPLKKNHREFTEGSGEELALVVYDSSGSGDSDRVRVKEALDRYRQAISNRSSKIEISNILTDLKKFLSNDGTPIVESVKGIEIGDTFHNRLELNLVGLHRPSQAGIDYIEVHKHEQAVSVVASSDKLDNSGLLIYKGQKGKGEDEQPSKGNLALWNSYKDKNSVRVIRNSKDLDSKDGNAKYVYDGLYQVEQRLKETKGGKHEYEFGLRRKPGQAELVWKVQKVQRKKSKSKSGIFQNDISGGLETYPIRAVNLLDNEDLPTFVYTVKMIYPSWYKPKLPKHCDCTPYCLDCVCVGKNGGSLPYDSLGTVVETKPVIYECGPFCKCPHTCSMRITQVGITYCLEVFRKDIRGTNLRGWGVRSQFLLKKDKFICEYTGELIKRGDAEVKRLAGKSEYLYDIGSKPESDDDTGGYTIDAGEKGNIARFIKRSPLPNLYVKYVVYNHEGTRDSHVTFFAMKDIQPYEELSYGYDYTIEQVAEGNIENQNDLVPDETEGGEWGNCSFEDDMHHSSFQEEEGEKVPYVGDKEPLSSLSSEYRLGSPILLEKIKMLENQYIAIRRTRRDGNCFFRSFMFSYLEHIWESQDRAEVDRIKVNVENCRKNLQNLRYTDSTFENFFALFLEQLDNILQGSEESISHDELVNRSRDQSVSDSILMFFRFVTVGEIRTHTDFFEPFIAGLSNTYTTVDQFCKSSVEPMGEESDHVHITALSNALGVAIRIVNLDCSSCATGVVTVNHHDFFPRGTIDKEEAAAPFITLLYRPGHYDILYRK